MRFPKRSAPLPSPHLLPSAHLIFSLSQIYDWIQKWWPRLRQASSVLITFASQQKNLTGGGTRGGGGATTTEGRGGQENHNNSDHVTIPMPVKNALKTFSVLLDLTSSPRSPPQPHHGAAPAPASTLSSSPSWKTSGSPSSRSEKGGGNKSTGGERAFQRMFLDKFAETGHSRSSYSSLQSDSESVNFYLQLSPAEIVFISAFCDLSSLTSSPAQHPTHTSPSSQGQGLTGRTDTERQQQQGQRQGPMDKEEEEEKEEIMTPSFLIQFMLTTSDPQASSSATQVLLKLLSHLKRALHFHPSDSQLMAWNASGLSWNELRFKELKSAGGIFAYDVFCGIFDGIGKILAQEYEVRDRATRGARAGGGRAAGEGDEQRGRERSPLGSLHVNLLETLGRGGGLEGKGQRKGKDQLQAEQAKQETELRSLIWEPLLIDMIELLQVLSFILLPLPPLLSSPLLTVAS
jgi:hypothetical protein